MIPCSKLTVDPAIYQGFSDSFPRTIGDVQGRTVHLPECIPHLLAAMGDGYANIGRWFMARMAKMASDYCIPMGKKNSWPISENLICAPDCLSKSPLEHEFSPFLPAVYHSVFSWYSMIVSPTGRVAWNKLVMTYFPSEQNSTVFSENLH